MFLPPGISFITPELRYSSQAQYKEDIKKYIVVANPKEVVRKFHRYDMIECRVPETLEKNRRADMKSLWRAPSFAMGIRKECCLQSCSVDAGCW
jgi:hypothetical protein